MGATNFEHDVALNVPTAPVPVASIQQAFDQAHEQAAYDYGHAGYTGTIAEKPGYVLFEFPKELTRDEILDAINNGYEMWSAGGLIPPKRPEWANKVRPSWDRVIKVYLDKWGPCVAFVRDGTVTFCGFASC